MTARSRHVTGALLGAALAMAGCSDVTSPGAPRTLSLSVAATAAPTADGISARPTPVGLEQKDSVHTLVITDVQLVVRRIGVARADTVCSSGDDDGEHEDDWHRRDGCEELELGPVLVNVPLDGTVDPVFSVPLPEGTYRGVELQIHKPSLHNEADLAFLRENPLLEGVSLVADGTFDGQPFTFVQRIEARQRYVLDPPVVVTADGQPTNLTLHLDVAAWFDDHHGGLVSPVTANRGGENEGLVRANVLRSLNAFRDDDRDGARDEHDHEEHHG